MLSLALIYLEAVMASETSQGVQVKLFVGLLVSSEVRMHLNQSELWNQDQVVKSEDGQEMKVLRYQDKEYVGIMLEEKQLGLEELRSKENEVRDALMRYCPELGVEAMKVYVFPQIFLA